MNRLLTIMTLFVVAVGLSQVRASEVTYNDFKQEELNGYSLNDVFKDSDLSMFENGDVYTYNNFGYIGVDISTFNVDNLYNGHLIYTRFNITFDFSDSVRFYYTNSPTLSNAVIYTGIESEEDFSYIGNILDYRYINIFKSGITENTPYVIVFNELINIDLTALGLEDLSIDKLDYYYELYEFYKDGYVLDTNAFTFNVFERFTEFLYLLMSYSQIAMDFLFTSQTIGFAGLEIFGGIYFKFNITFIPFYGITTVAISMTLLYLAKKYIPFI